MKKRQESYTLGGSHYSIGIGIQLYRLGSWTWNYCTAKHLVYPGDNGHILE